MKERDHSLYPQGKPLQTGERKALLPRDGAGKAPLLLSPIEKERGCLKSLGRSLSLRPRDRRKARFKKKGGAREGEPWQFFWRFWATDGLKGFFGRGVSDVS